MLILTLTCQAIGFEHCKKRKIGLWIRQTDEQLSSAIFMSFWCIEESIRQKQLKWSWNHWKILERRSDTEKWPKPYFWESPKSSEENWGWSEPRNKRALFGDLFLLLHESIWIIGPRDRIV